MKARKLLIMAICGIFATSALCVASACNEQTPVVYINGFYRNEQGELILTKTDETEINTGSPYGAVTGERASKGLAYTLSADGTYYIVRGIGLCADLDVVIPETYAGLPIKEIGEEAFAVQSLVKSITVSKTVEKIGEDAFCSTFLADIHVAEENTHFSSSKGVLYTKDMTTLLVYPTDKDSTVFHVPDSVTKIETFAFDNNFHLRDLFLPAQIQPHDPTFYIMSNVENIFYKGNKIQWNDHKFNPFDATVYWYSEEKPTEIGKYWREKEGAIYVYEVKAPVSDADDTNSEDGWTGFY